MKRLLIFTFLLAFPAYVATAQVARIDSLKRLLTTASQDTSRVMTLTRLATQYSYSSTDTSMMLAQQALLLARKIHFIKGECRALESISSVKRVNGDFPQALDYALKSLFVVRALNEPAEEAWGLNQIGIIYFDLGEFRKAIHYYQQAAHIFEALSMEDGMVNELNNMTNAYISLQLLDSARIYNLQAQQLIRQIPKDVLRKAVLANYSGRLTALRGNYVEALRFYQQASALALRNHNIRVLCSAQLYTAELFNQIHKPDSSLHYARLALLNGQKLDYKANVLKASSLLTQIYKSINNADSALYYQDIARAANESLYGPKKFQQLQLLLLTEQQRQQELVTNQERYRNSVRIYTLLAVLALIGFFAFMMYRNSQQQQKANQILHRQKEEIDQQRDKAETAFTELKATQTQLIQREKMASLGELTAGIAHEIQNPLNFVNNFSEASAELVTELEEEQQKPERDTELEADLLGNLKQNLQKIHHHGGRASAIVKGMLEHSRSSTGEARPTDLNALASEYLKIAYQGQRAKAKDFTCQLITDLDPSLRRVEVMPQEIGRVLLNLFNNAFYAVQQRQRQEAASYQPTVTVQTQQTDKHIEVRISDNGVGIPAGVLEKIFQPFFTTKPTGEGTGLGLSLSYDIVTKGHGGTLTVESTEGEGTGFMIHLPPVTH